MHEVDLPKKFGQELRRDADEGLYHLPGAALFQDFCDELAGDLPHTLVRGAAQGVTKRADMTYDVLLAGHTQPLAWHSWERLHSLANV